MPVLSLRRSASASLVVGLLASGVEGLLVNPIHRPTGGHTPLTRLGRVHMILDDRPGNKEPGPVAFENPFKVIATVIAQADIVGVEMPTKVPSTFVAPAEDAALSSRLPNGARREVDRECVHPLLKLFDGDAIEPWLQSLLALPTPLLMTMVVPLLLLHAPLILYLVAQRKAAWAEEVDASAAEHRAAFDEAWQAYRDEQVETVDRLLAARASGVRDPLLPPLGAPFTVAVTMATGQEGRAVVKALSEATEAFPTLTVKALVRDPLSAKAQELATFPRVQLVKADSLDAASLEAALEGVDAAYLCTTLNSAAAGTWEMDWTGGQYEVEQGTAFATAASRIPTLKQVVYGTAPMRKWPTEYRVEPPIHYAAKWRIEEIVREAGLPLTCVRKCPYHENFTKLTKPQPRADGQGNGNWWEPGTYLIKALTPPTFEYNMLGPGDIGAWALLALAHPSILGGGSLSIAADCLTGTEMAARASEADAFGPDVAFEYKEQPRWLFETLAFVEPTFVYICGLQRWNSDGGRYDLLREDVAKLRELHAGTTWKEHLRKDGLEQFTSTMAELLPDMVKRS